MLRLVCMFCLVVMTAAVIGIAIAVDSSNIIWIAAGIATGVFMIWVDSFTKNGGHKHGPQG